MPSPHILKDAPLVIPFTFDVSSIPISPSSSSLEHYPSPIPLARPTAVASYGFNDDEADSSSRRRGLVVGCDDGTLWIVPCDDDRDQETRTGGVVEGGGGTIAGGGGSSSSTSFPPLPSLPEITTTDDSSSELAPLSPNNKAPTISPTHRFPRPLRPSSRSSSPKPTSAHHLGNPLLPHATPTGRNRVLSTSSIASNHTAYSIATNTTPPPPASASTLVNKGRIVSGLSATVAAPPTITTGEETLGERKEELRGLLEQSSSSGGGRRGRNGGGSISSILSGAGGLGTATTSLEDVLESLSLHHKPSSPPPSNLHHPTPTPLHHASNVSSNRSSFSSSRRISSASGAGPHAGESTSTSASAPLSPSEDFVKLPQSPTTLPPGGLPLPGSSRHSFSSLREGASSPRLGAGGALPPSAIPFGLTREGGSRADVKCSEGGKRVVHVLPGVGVGGGEGGVKALEVLEERGWVVCLLGSGYVSIFSLLDGLCLSTVQIPSSVASSSFVWNSMAVSKSASTYRAIITGSTTTPPWDPSFSSDSPSPSRSSKIVVLDLEEMECLPCPTPVPDLPFAISTVQLISKEEEPPLLLLSPSSSPSHHLLPFTLHPHSHPHPPSNPNTTSSTPTSSPNPSSPPPPAPSSHSTDLSAKVVTKAFKDLFHRASASSKPTSSTTDGAGGLVAGGWTLSFGEVQSLVASSSNELGVAGRGGCLSFGAGRWVDWFEGETGGVEVWELVVGQDGKKERKVLTRLEVKGLKGVEVLDEGKGLVLRSENDLSVYSLVASDLDGVEAVGERKGGVVLYRLEKSLTISLSTTDSSVLSPISTGGTFLVDSSPSGLIISLLPSVSSISLSDIIIIASPRPSSSATVVLSAGDEAIDQIFVGDDQGRLSRLSITSVLSPSSASTPSTDGTSETRSLEGSVTCLVRAHNSRTGTKHVVGGADDGSVGVWDADSLLLQGRWSMFTSPVISIHMLSERTAGRLRGCLLCVSAEGTIGFVVLDGLELLYLIPGTRAPLSKIYIGDEESILLMYENEQARLWDLRSQELRRSMAGGQAKELIERGGWMEVCIDSRLDQTSLDTVSSLPQVVTSASVDAALTILLDIRALHTLLAPDAKIRPPIVEEPALLLEDVATPAPVKTLRPLVPLLSALVTWGLDKEMDTRCEEGLGLVRRRDGSVRVGLRGADGSVTISREDDPFRVWKTSPAHTGFRSLAIVSILQMYLSVDTYEAAASEVISFYAARLQDTVGEGFQVATLAFYAEYWLHSSVEIQQAARVLFGSVLAQTPDEEILAVVERCQHELPCCQPDGLKNSEVAARALVLVGQIAVENYSLFPPALLKDVSTSITFYLHDDDSPYRQLAIDLCSSGFQIWQHYIDAMEILRSLFRLATQKAPFGHSSSLAAQARHATLQIASSNTPLFMTTLAFDILNASTPAQRNATMKLVAFMAKRRPLVLYSSLARIAEAVVKSLDPNVSVLRDAVQQTATVILDSLVSTFPSIDFHGKSQRLAVGTHEGAVILYDLKTATRLFVLEGHKHKITACSFSPDGRRVVTVSLDESKVVVWKVGMSFGSLFNVGTPPRQGGPKPGDPYKTYDFNIGDEGNMTTAASLEWVKFEWPGERSARLRIRETALTFAT